ncbi:MAG: FecR domain-containing protein [Deltaproteobacteria bacterium]|nr:FecR domain-containing protein [Deltaproteobacteria bacterium]
MTPDEKMIDGICRRIDQDLGDGTNAAKLRNFEAVILAETLKQKPVQARRLLPMRKMWIVAAAAIPVLLSAVFYLGIAAEDTPLQLMVDNAKLHSLSQAVLRTGPDNTKVIRFANDSSIKLLENTDAAVKKATNDEVIVQLAAGELFLDVEGKESEHWIVTVGSYRVSVLGTQFYVKWHRQGKLLDVRVVKGTVLVEGQHAGKVGIAVHRDTHLRVDTQTGFAVMNMMTSPFYDAETPSLLRNEGDVRLAWNDRMGIHEKGAVGALAEPQSNNWESVQSASHRGHGTGLKRHLSAGRRGDHHRHSHPGDELDQIGDASQDTEAVESDKDWRGRLAMGDAEGAISAAEAAGFSNMTSEATLAQLWQLMNAARKSGRDDLAEQILLTCRSRFATSRKARLAAFVLGKVNYYGKNDPASAAQWFHTYLDETPSGPLAEEAMGRLVAIQAECGKTAEAKELAQKYLKQYPNGAFAHTCQELIRN